MGRFAHSTKSSMIVAVFVLFIGGCAATGNVGTGHKTDTLSENTTGEDTSFQAPQAPEPSMSLLRVEVLDEAAATVVRMGATGPLRDYHLEKLGSEGFSLNLGDINDRANLPVLPSNSGRLSLSYPDAGSTRGLEIVGNCRQPLENYILDSMGDELVLTLYFVKEEPLPAPVKEPPRQSVPENARKEQYHASMVPLEKVSSRHEVEPVRRSVRPAVSTVSEEAPAFRLENASLTDSQPAQHALVKQYTGKPISLDLLEADVRNVLRLLSDITGKNIVIEPDVAGKVTLKVEQVPWDQILDMVLAMNDLGKEQVGNVIRIARQDKLKGEWTQKAEEIRAKQDLQEVAKDLGEINTVYFTVNYAQPQDIAAKMTENKSERGRVAIDERTSLIIYSDYPARIESARQLLARLDKATPQVLIEARIVTLRSQASRSLGINWSFSTDHTTVDPGLTQQFQINVPPPGPSTFGFNMGQLIGKTFLQVEATISALETSQDLKIIASPKVLTLNNVEAQIKQGTQIPYQNIGLGNANATSTEFKDATVELKVTPHITPDQKVRLKIFAKQDEPGTEFNGQTSIDKREITTELLVDDGNVIVIGGVIRDRSETGNSGTPGLNKIPLLGRLFRKDTSIEEQAELLIFISPKIVEVQKRALGA